MNIKQALGYAKSIEYVIMICGCSERMEYSRRTLKEAVEKVSVGILIESKCEFEISDVDKIKSVEEKIIIIGHRILRTEMAEMAALFILMWLMYD
ncbi:MAG: hypothetical protein IJV15_13485 [Lachnospiraceae bacterium]|nr:hypothetical protein [Lachnospiraceae bacterium]